MAVLRDFAAGRPRLSRLLTIVLVVLAIGTVMLFVRLRPPKTVALTEQAAVDTPASPEDPESAPWSKLTFLLFVENATDPTQIDNSWQRFRQESGDGPTFQVVTWQTLPDKPSEEMSQWANVRVEHVATFLGTAKADIVGIDGERSTMLTKLALNALLRSVHDLDHVVAYVNVHAKEAGKKPQIIFDPRPSDLNDALKSMASAPIRASMKRCRQLANDVADALRQMGSAQESAKAGEIGFLSYSKRIYPDTLEHDIDCLVEPSEETPSSWQKCSKAERKRRAQLTRPVKTVDLGFRTVDGESRTDQLVHCGCLVDVRQDVLVNDLMTEEVDGDILPEHVRASLADPNKRLLVVGLPTTAKGMRKGSEHVLLRALLPSLVQTVDVEEELSNWTIMVYVGFDHGDSVWDDAGARKRLRARAEAIVGGRPIGLRLFRLPNTKRVAMLWSFLYGKAMRDGATYFYQVNDDLTLVTPRWLSNFTTTLDAAEGFGVAGPSDEFHGFKCAVLTQSIIGRPHWHIFQSLYPVGMKDWKTDRWLTWVYPREHTHCSKSIIANNGASGTRYSHCDYLHFWLLVEDARARIQRWRLLNNLPPVDYPADYVFKP